MNLFTRPLWVCSLVSSLAIASTLLQSENSKAAESSCSIPALSRIQRHTVSRGETLESIAQRYNLVPETISAMNPSVRNGYVKVNTEIQIPPFNGIVVQVPRGQTWRQVAAKYKIRVDTLFEVNGCQKDPKIVFVPLIPGVKNSTNGLVMASPMPTMEIVKIAGFPLKNETTVGLAYGWQIEPVTRKVFFHSGIDLIAPVGSSVEAIAPGVVVFAKEQESYGKLVIINHNGGLQSRYAQLDTINVTLGQQIKQGDILGTVGTTGKPTSTQPHLHFEMRTQGSLGWVAEDPKGYLTK
ncbi:M23 family metallopeptidase [Cronbergia sp. UHCC 0137]|uniref:LysM peptidoglycan-binding domain-containing M23 family metallopeptidase n=1 Tax=Cronbergia sp. UHCC 0137 TaxID=3110239 RepID=UPI002B21E2F9|nr:M23 family metallopeptidase [Cronbergia sp. UHCC 0137]MEA5619152.1 M23 family metallopeptidase [Cronbergia sp. UHCC 0137]